MKAYAAEFIGTYSLAFVITIMVASGSPYIPFAAGITLMLFVYTVGHISGAHINPAVTIALWYVKKMSGNEAISYIAAQCMGAIFALGTAWVLIPDLASQLKPIQTLMVNELPIGLAEGLGTFMLCFGIMAVVTGKVKQELSGVVIGGSLLAGLFIAGSASNAVLNPAVALTLGSVNIMYIVGPIVGGALGMRMYLLLSPEK